MQMPGRGDTHYAEMNSTTIKCDGCIDRAYRSSCIDLHNFFSDRKGIVKFIKLFKRIEGITLKEYRNR